MIRWKRLLTLAVGTSLLVASPALLRRVASRSPGVTAAAGGAEPSSNGGEVDVRSFGARCDGATNDSAAFQTAILAADNAHGIVDIPSGTCRVNLTMPNIPPFIGGVMLRGKGEGSTFLVPFKDAPVLTFSASGRMDLQGFTVEDLCMNDVKGFKSPAIYFTGDNINDHHIFRNLVMGQFHTAIDIAGRTIWTRFEDVQIYSSGGDAIVISGDPGMFVGALNFDGLEVLDAVGRCVYANGSTGNGGGLVNVHFHDGTLENCNGGGAVINNINGLEIDNMDLESNGAAGLYPNVLLGGDFVRGFDIHANTFLGITRGHALEVAATRSIGEVHANMYLLPDDRVCRLKIDRTVSGPLSELTGMVPQRGCDDRPVGDSAAGIGGAAAAQGGLGFSNLQLETASAARNVSVNIPAMTIPAHACYGAPGSTHPAAVAMPGLTPNMGVEARFTGNPSSIAGWGATGGLSVKAWTAAPGQAGYVVCNATAAAIHSGAIRLLLVGR